MRNKLVGQFNKILDRNLGIKQNKPKLPLTLHPDVEHALEMAEILSILDFTDEVKMNSDLQQTWIEKTRKRYNPQYHQKWNAKKFVWGAVLTLFVVTLFAFRQPVFGAVSRLFGYVFIPNAGFYQIDSTLVLSQPVQMEYDGRNLTVTQGVASLNNTILWIEFSDIASPVDGAVLATEAGENIRLDYWEFSPDLPRSRFVKAYFPALSKNTKQTTLILREGWNLPLEWIPARLWIAESASTGTNSTLAEPQLGEINSCIEVRNISLCVLAGAANEEFIRVLIEANSLDGFFSFGNRLGEITHQSIGGNPITLQDSQGNIIEPISEFSNRSTLQLNQQILVFPAAEMTDRQVTLNVPAVTASVDLDQAIVIDLGPDPQPGDIIPVDADIQVLASTVHFNSAELQGDGITGLRLILDADQVETVNGITPLSLKLGTIEGIDDLYGNGLLAGSKDLFVELMRPSGKVTGLLSLPIVGATVSVGGPFEVNFDIDDSLEFSVPTAATSDSKPSKTNDPATSVPSYNSTETNDLFPMDEYKFMGHNLNPGDLLFTVINGEHTDLYLYSPDSNQSVLFAVLPGAVSNIYIHPDLKGLDYFTGAKFNISGYFSNQNVRLFTLRFEDPEPRLLYTFPPISGQYQGVQLQPTWSFDGRFVVFNSSGINPQPGDPAFKYGWLDLACREGGDCVLNSLQIPNGSELYNAVFSPADYRLLFSGSDQYSNRGVFLMAFDPEGETNRIVRFPGTDKVAGRSIWLSDKRVLSICSEKSLVSFCFFDLETGEISYSPPISEQFYRYYLSPSGDQILSSIINHQRPKGNLEIRLFNLDGQPGSLLASEMILGDIHISPSGQYLVFTTGDAKHLKLINISNQTNSIIFDCSEETYSFVSWASWISLPSE